MDIPLRKISNNVIFDDECIIKTKSCEYEYSIYDHLRGLRGFPPYTKLCCSEAGNHLHLSFLGQPLSQFLNTNLDIFPRKTIYMLAIQLIDRMKALYGKGIAHRSIQPDHIVVNTKTNVVYLISFSRAKFIEQSPYNMGQLLQATENLRENETTSTSPYASVKAQGGVDQLPFSDLESLGYVLYRFSGPLPWESENEEDMILAKTRSLQDLLSHPWLGEYFRYLNDRQPDKAPDYEYLRNIFIRQLDEARLVNDGAYDWGIDEEREICRKRTLHMLEKIAGLEVRAITAKDQGLVKILWKLLAAHRYVLKQQHPSYVSLKLRTNEDHLLVIAKAIAGLKAYCLNLMGRPYIPISLICYAYSNICAFAELWPEFTWDEALRDLARILKKREED